MSQYVVKSQCSSLCSTHVALQAITLQLTLLQNDIQAHIQEQRATQTRRHEWRTHKCRVAKCTPQANISHTGASDGQQALDRIARQNIEQSKPPQATRTNSAHTHATHPDTRNSTNPIQPANKAHRHIQSDITKRPRGRPEPVMHSLKQTNVRTRSHRA